MKAVVLDTYGSFDLLQIRDIAKPGLKDDAVLVRVHAAGLHVGDCFAVRGSPFAVRFVCRDVRVLDGRLMSQARDLRAVPAR